MSKVDIPTKDIDVEQLFSVRADPGSVNILYSTLHTYFFFEYPLRLPSVVSQHGNLLRPFKIGTMYL